MNDNKESPFEKRSTITSRSPSKNRRTPSEYPEERTRSQTITRPPTPPPLPTKQINTKNQTNKKPSIPKTVSLKTIANRSDNRPPTPPIISPKLISDIQVLPEQTLELPKTPIKQDNNINRTELTSNRQIQKQATHNSPKMNQQQIQQIISSSVPEFSGENTVNRTNDLFRFTTTADSIYHTLNSEDERKTFDKLIKLRLTGEAFTRISHRNIDSYITLRDLLNNMYSKTYSLEELERGYINIQQSYGETIRNYGYRLLEALEQYKVGYKTKYNLQQVDEAYVKHLETNSVQIFKRGLNNTILREKVATSIAKNIDEMINETEVIERMLTATTETATPQSIAQKPLPNYPSRPQQIINQIICNYCQRPNHTWDTCRTRMNQERINRLTTQTRPYTQQFQNPNQLKPYNQQFQNPNRVYQPSNTFQNPVRPESYNRRYSPPTQPPTNFRQNPQPIRFPSKYCSHCKVTTGHTFDECRSKFFTRNVSQPNTQNHPPTPTDTGDLANKFNNMRINMIYPQSEQNSLPPEQYTHQGNFNRSDQS